MIRMILEIWTRNGTPPILLTKIQGSPIWMAIDVILMVGIVGLFFSLNNKSKETANPIYSRMGDMLLLIPAGLSLMYLLSMDSFDAGLIAMLCLCVAILLLMYLKYHRPATEEQIKKIETMRLALNIDDDTYHNILVEKYNKSSTKKLTIYEALDIVEYLEENYD